MCQTLGKIFARIRVHEAEKRTLLLFANILLLLLVDWSNFQLVICIHIHVPQILLYHHIWTCKIVILDFNTSFKCKLKFSCTHVFGFERPYLVWSQTFCFIVLLVWETMDLFFCLLISNGFRSFYMSWTSFNQSD